LQPREHLQIEVLLLVASLSTSGSLTLTSLEFPSHVMLGQSLSMNCGFTKDPSQQIDSIKWYKDGREFFRLHPGNSANNNDNHIKQFQTAGVKIDYNASTFHSLPQSGHHSLTFVNTKLSTSGIYRCQITQATPPFHTEQQDRNLTIIIQPEKGSPRIKVSRNALSLGQQASVECWSDRSKPHADLQFFINGNRVPKEKVGDIEVYSESDGQLETSYRKMTFTVRENHLSASSLDVKCNANIGDAYWQTSQAKIEIIGRPSYMLESRSNTNQEKGESTALTLLVSILFFSLHAL